MSDGSSGSTPPGWYPDGSGTQRTGLFALLGGLVLVVAVGLVLFFVLRGGDDPESVAQEYLDAGVDGDFARVCELTTEESQQVAFDDLDVDDCDAAGEAVDDELGGMGELSLDDFDFTFDITDVSEADDGESATVTVDGTTTYVGDDEDLAEFYGTEEESSTEELELVKEDGEWRVDTGIF